ncbi:LOW QUALITY PROTEIN: male-enhanced antigen 1 [Xiphophorus hellerii]|uniref:LOW QUALITY PROTEIN: male-enhanced antigen 1 n=1 Tax=Xiphophorus hellerii TaxID=8084 RepID=UPI0013B46406|nr:LOW QUALITY PROTEIN: male-enhanced antigen 1-like [Xiphophorus hellerii]
MDLIRTWRISITSPEPQLTSEPNRSEPIREQDQLIDPLIGSPLNQSINMRSISSRAERAHGHALMSSFHGSAASQSRFGSNGTASIRTGSDSDPGGKGGLGLLQPGSNAVGRAEGVRAPGVFLQGCVSWMEVCRSAMGPERVLPSSEDELGEDERPVDGAVLPGGEDGVEEEEEESGGYYYQPLNQDPDGPGEPEEEDRGDTSHSEQLQHRIEVMGLHLPEAPPPDSDEEEDPEGAAAQRSRASIPMDPAHVELVKRTMAGVALPSLGVPPWAQQISDAQWSDLVQNALQERQSSAGLRMLRRNHVP